MTLYLYIVENINQIQTKRPSLLQRLKKVKPGKILKTAAALGAIGAASYYAYKHSDDIVSTVKKHLPFKTNNMNPESKNFYEHLKKTNPKLAEKFANMSPEKRQGLLTAFKAEKQFEDIFAYRRNLKNKLLKMDFSDEKTIKDIVSKINDRNNPNNQFMYAVLSKRAKEDPKFAKIFNKMITKYGLKSPYSSDY